jgi:transposase-like protein
LVCKVCGKWFQINRKEKPDTTSILFSHLAGESFRSLADKYGFSHPTAFRRYHESVQSLLHCVDITRQYCNRFCGILLVDGKYVAVKGYDRKIPVVYGIDYLTHDIPHYVLSVAENYPTCHSFFTSLRLANYPLQAIVSDDNINIYQAGTSVYPKAITQLCQNHYKEGIRDVLQVRTDSTFQPFMDEVELLFAKRMQAEEFNRMAGKIYYRFKDNDTCRNILIDIQKRLPQLLAYTQVSQVPRTTNLIESFNSHLEGRLKTIKGFESFKHADAWLNAYFIRRRLKKFTDCEKKFRHLNGKCSLEMSIKHDHKFDDVLRLIR